MNVLLTSAGRRSYLAEYFKEALAMAGRGGLVHAANSQPGPAFPAADRQAVTPLIYEEAYLPFLLDYCRREDIGMVVPLFDIDVPVLAASRQAFEAAGTTVVTAGPEEAALCNDKWKTFLRLKEEGIGVPASWLSEEDALEAVRTGQAAFPLMVKPRWGMGSLSVYRAEDEAELGVFVRKIRREIRESYLKYEAAGHMDRCVLIQETLRGQEYGLDIVNDLQGRFRAVSVKRKLAMRSGETDAAETARHSGLEQLGERLGRLLGHRGNLDADVFETDQGLFVLELNARFGGGYPFSHAAGMHLPYALVKWAMGEEPEPEYLTARPGVRAYKDIRICRWPEGTQTGNANHEEK